jgi:hypothetical protein
MSAIGNPLVFRFCPATIQSTREFVNMAMRTLGVPVVSYHDVPWATHWPLRILGSSEGGLVHVPKQDRVLPNSLVVCWKLQDLNESLLQEIAQTPGIGLFHVGDEWFREDYRVYENFAYVWRNYLHTGMLSSHVRQAPLGPHVFSKYKDWFAAHTLSPASQRKFCWMFAGYVQANRAHMLRCLTNTPGGYVHVCGSFDKTAQSLDQEQYYSLMSNSAFAPAPMGNVTLESFRIYEALDCGAVPIVEKRKGFDYFSLLFGPHPLPCVMDWTEAPKLISHWISAPSALDDLQSRVMEWWSQLRKKLSSDLAADCVRHANQASRIHFDHWPVGKARAFREVWRHQCWSSLSYRLKLLPVRLLRRICARPNSSR